MTHGKADTREYIREMLRELLKMAKAAELNRLALALEGSVICADSEDVSQKSTGAKVIKVDFGNGRPHD